ncbi:MAG: apolipoprotein N-acyltransferase [Deltaproteobacteria bacterium]|nr:apolipoprotein N-acyltransferase [Deltaproteobacteria bacterium]
MTAKFIAAVFSGLLLAAAFPRWDQAYLLPVALVPLFLALRGLSPGAAFWVGLVHGLAAFGGILYWIAYVTNVFGGLPLPAAVGVMLLLAGYLALYRGLWSLGVAWGEKRGLGLLWFAPVLWVALEYLQTYMLSGFPWELLGYGVYRHPMLLQVADLTGVYGLSFLIVLVNVAVCHLVFPPRGKGGGRLQPALLLLLVAALWLGYGYFRLGAVQKLAAQAPKIKVAVVQGNIKQGEKWKKELVEATIKRYADLTAKAGGARLVIWPETAAPFFYSHTPDLAAQVQDIVRKNHSFLLFGALAMDKKPEGDIFYNRAYLLSPQGETLGRYDKAHLVPFGEYVPLKRILFFVNKMVPMIGDFGEGPVGATVPLPEAKVGPLICFESIFAYLSRAQVEGGARLLVNITNDAWFGTTSAPYQHLAMGVLRAVEGRVSLARAANTGFSAFVDPAGRLLWRSGLFEPDSRVEELPLMPGGSLYTRYGDVFAWACVILAALALVFKRRRFRERD